MEVESVLITGSNRGIGLEFVRQLVQLKQPPRYVFATYRRGNNLKELKRIQDSSVKSKVILIKMDVTLQEELEIARTIVEEIVGDRGLTLLINNAGILQEEALPYVTPENLELHFRVNTVAPLMVLQTMLPLLEKAASYHSGGMSVRKAAVLNISSTLGSIRNAELAQGLKAPSYQISKAALNMAMRVTAASIREKGILVIMMCPGWVKTDMGGPNAQLTPDESVDAILKTLATLNETHHGIFMDNAGNECPF